LKETRVFAFIIVSKKLTKLYSLDNFTQKELQLKNFITKNIKEKIGNLQKMWRPTFLLKKKSTPIWSITSVIMRHRCKFYDLILVFNRVIYKLLKHDFWNKHLSERMWEFCFQFNRNFIKRYLVSCKVA